MNTHICPTCKVTQVQSGYKKCSCCEQKYKMFIVCPYPLIKCPKCGKPTVKDKSKDNPTYCYGCKKDNKNKEKEMNGKDTGERYTCSRCMKDFSIRTKYGTDEYPLCSGCLELVKMDAQIEFNSKRESLMQNPLVIHVKSTYEKAVNLMEKKNADYAGDEDPLANFRAVENNNLTDMKTAILVRMSDKWVRICNLHSKQEASVKDESIEDTLLDLMNYAAIYLYANESQDEKGL